MEITLIHGLTVEQDGEPVTHHKTVLKELTVGELFDAQKAAERVIHTDTGVHLLQSDVEFGIELVRRAIVSIGDIQGPLSVEQMRGLMSSDLTLIQSKLDGYEAAAMQAAEARGRSNPVSAED